MKTFLLGAACVALLGTSAIAATALMSPPSPSTEAANAEPAQSRPRVAKSIAPGLGFSRANPVGTPFALPEGLELETPIVAWSPENPVDCDEKYSDESYGTGEEVRVCLIFRNTTNRPITVTLPPGLLLVATNDDVQNGFIVQTTTIVVPAGERYFAPLFAYCSNENRSTTGNEDRYQMGPVLDHPDLQALFSVLEGKTLSREEAGLVQTAVDEVTQGEGLSAARRAELAAF